MCVLQKANFNNEVSMGSARIIKIHLFYELNQIMNHRVTVTTEAIVKNDLNPDKKPQDYLHRYQ